MHNMPQEERWLGWWRMDFDLIDTTKRNPSLF